MKMENIYRTKPELTFDLSVWQMDHFTTFKYVTWLMTDINHILSKLGFYKSIFTWYHFSCYVAKYIQNYDCFRWCKIKSSVIVIVYFLKFNYIGLTKYAANICWYRLTQFLKAFRVCVFFFTINTHSLVISH